MTKIAQNISPGPAKYSQRTNIGKPSQTFLKSTVDPADLSMVAGNVGPATYDTISAIEKQSLKRHPRVIIGNSKRLFLGTSAPYPAPDKYSTI